jgi:hypothetical protein
MGIYTGVLYPRFACSAGIHEAAGTRTTGIDGRVIENGMTVDTLLVVVWE